jgi:pyruvate carboxylase
VVAPIPGLVLKVLVKEGDVVKQDQPVIMLEAMKMESEITSTVTGTIKKIHVKEGDSVQERQLLMEVEG